MPLTTAKLAIVDITAAEFNLLYGATMKPEDPTMHVKVGRNSEFALWPVPIWLVRKDFEKLPRLKDIVQECLDGQYDFLLTWVVS